MSSSFKYAACGAIVAFCLIACGTRSARVEKQPVASVRNQVDAARNRVWLLTRAGLAIYDAAAPDRIVQVPMPGWQFAGEPYGCLPDLALGPRGEAVISSDVVPVQGEYLAVSASQGTVWRIDRNLQQAHRMVRQVPRAKG